MVELSAVTIEGGDWFEDAEVKRGSKVQGPSPLI
jgi:hypothetical protein